MRTIEEIRAEINTMTHELKEIKEAIEDEMEEYYLLNQIEDYVYHLESEIKLLKWVLCEDNVNVK